MKYRISIILLFMILLIAGCEAREVETEAEAERDTDTNVSETIIWAVPSGYGNLYIDEVNERLQNDGYDFQLKLSYLDENDYYNLLLESLENGNADIVSMAFLEADQIAELVRGNYLYEFTDYLNSSSGEALRNAFYDELWESVSIDGSVCLIPNQVGQDGTGYYVFNKSYFTEEELESFDGTPQELYELLVQKGNLENEVVWDWDVYQLAYTSRQQFAYGVLLGFETGDVCNVYESFSFLQQADAVQEMLSTGYFGLNGKYYQMDHTQTYENKISNLDFAVWVGTDTSLLYEELKEDVITVQAPFAFINRTQWSVGMNNQSKKTEEVLQLLTLLHTNETYANLLLCGMEGTTYEMNNGYAELYENENSLFVNELVTGLFDLIVPLEEDSFPINRVETKWSLYDGEYSSLVTGFYPDSTALSVDLEYFETIAASGIEKYIAGSSTLEELESDLAENGADTVKTELQAQITDYLN